MSYNATGSYYTFSPHQIYRGQAPSLRGFGAVGSSQFDAAAVWQDIAESNKCYGSAAQQQKGWQYLPGQQGKCNAAGQRANKAIAAALNELGYGPIAVDGSISWKSAYAKFLNDFGLTAGPGYGITQQALATMETQIAEQNTPGPNKPVEYDKVGTDYIPKGKPGETATAGMGGVAIVALLAVAGAVTYAVVKKRREDKAGGAKRLKGSKSKKSLPAPTYKTAGTTASPKPAYVL